MSDTAKPIVYTEVEIRSDPPSGWGIQGFSAGRWNAKSGRWAIDVYDGADNVWTVEVGAREAGRAGRLEALRDSIDRIQRKSLGRKSFLTG